jgi:hypothetical protein
MLNWVFFQRSRVLFVYSKNIFRFINKINISLKSILTKELGLQAYGDRFYDKNKNYSYPISIVVFNDRSMLGYFDPSLYELGFHERLMHVSQEQLLNVIRHEIAHYMTFIHHGHLQKPHGSEFKAFCQSIKGWKEEVQKATICLDDGEALPREESSVLRKVQKLMALAGSSNPNEAEAAMIKSQQLLLKHNLDLSCIEDEGDERMFLKRIMKQKQKDMKMRSIAKILETFFVSTVFNRIDGFSCLEILGSAVNIEIAEYVAEVLSRDFDVLWNQVKKSEPSLKGHVAKNSFFLGIAQGYCNKIQSLKRGYDKDTSHALVVIEKKLEEARDMAYPRLSRSNSYARLCSESSRLGEMAGKNLQINPGISRGNTNPQAAICFIE